MKVGYTLFHSSIIHNSQKVETTRRSMDRWIDKMYILIDIIEFYSGLKREDILTYATTWVSLEDTMLSEISQLSSLPCDNSICFIKQQGSPEKYIWYLKCFKGCLMHGNSSNISCCCCFCCYYYYSYFIWSSKRIGYSILILVLWWDILFLTALLRYGWHTMTAPV